MNRFGKYVYSVMVCWLTFSLLAACAPQATTIATTAPEQGVTEEVPASDDVAPTEEQVPLRPAEFDGTITEGTIGGAPVFIGNGTLVNDAGQTLLITVTGSSQASVDEYLRSALFFFEITSDYGFAPDTEPQEKIEDLSLEKLFQDTAAENLTIEFQVSEETAKELPRGVVYLVVDPTVRQYQFNNYATRDPWDDRLYVKVQTSAGKVTARLYRQCIYRTGAVVPAPYATPISSSGAGKFDIAVQGNNSGSNTYRLTGAWSYDYTTIVYSVATQTITC